MQVKNKTSYKTRLMAVTSYSLFTALCHRKPTGLAFSTVPPEAYRASLPLLPRLTLINKKKRSARWPSMFWEGSHSRSICGHQAAHTHRAEGTVGWGTQHFSALNRVLENASHFPTKVELQYFRMQTADYSVDSLPFTAPSV